MAMRNGVAVRESGSVIGGGVRDDATRDVKAAVRLAELRSAGLVRSASEPRDVPTYESLPVAAPLRSLLPGGGLRRGGTVAVAPGSTSLLLALLAEASRAGSWCAAVGLPHLGLVSAAEVGIAVERLALVPYPGPEWPSVVAALLDGVDIVAAAIPGEIPARVASRLAARARQRGGVLVPVGRWPGADLVLEVVHAVWHGLSRGRGRLRSHEVEITAYGRGAAARPRRARVRLPWAAGAAPHLTDLTHRADLTHLADLGKVRVDGDQLMRVSPRSASLGEAGVAAQAVAVAVAVAA